MVVVAYDMARELPRTLHSLSRNYQRGVEDLSYEVIVVDNGSSQPISANQVSEFGSEYRLLKIESANASPASALNQGVALARGRHLGLVVDGARVLSPGVLHWANQAFRLHPDAVVSTLGLHLGPEHQAQSSQRGYNREIEDRLMQQIGWPGDGYRLFEVASLANSCRFGWHGPMAESNCVFLPREVYAQIGGYEEKFRSPGGGLVNLDFYQRACCAAGRKVVHLVGEGCFHQIHGGVTTGGAQTEARKFNQLQDEYRSIRGEILEPGKYQPILLGATPAAAYPLVAQGVAAAMAEHVTTTMQDHLQQAGLEYPLEPPSPA